jgi:hypothetical protein
MPTIRLLFLIAILPLTLSCATSPPPYVYMPTEDGSTLALFSQGVPYALQRTDCSEVRSCLDRVRMAGDRYVRVWILYQNTSPDTVLFDPFACLKLGSITAGRRLPVVEPMLPSEVLRRIEKKQSIARFGQVLAGMADALTTQPTVIRSSSGQELVVSDIQAKQRAASDRQAAALAAIDVAANAAKKDFSSTVLRRNTVLPGGGITGFVFFRAPALPTPVSRPLRMPAPNIFDDLFAHQLEISLPCTTLTITFRPIQGE